MENGRASLCDAPQFLFLMFAFCISRLCVRESSHDILRVGFCKALVEPLRAGLAAGVPAVVVVLAGGAMEEFPAAGDLHLLRD